MTDIKLLASQRLTDNADGGGLITSTEILDGVVNNMFPNISRVDRTIGVVNLRKGAIKADSADTALYNGLHAIITDGPDDPRVTVTAFSTNSWSDERADAQSAMERYLDESVPTRMIPFDRQLAGQRTLLVFQRPELDLPSIGENYVISALPNETVKQFVRVSNLTHSVQTFTDPSSGQDFQARVITLTLTEPLATTFLGTQPSRLFSAAANTSIVRKTIVSDATSYHTIHSLAEDAAIGDLTIKLGSIFAQLVPSSTQEAAITNASPTGAVYMVPSGPATSHTTTAFASISLIIGSVFYAGSPLMPGTVTLQRDGGGWNYHDDGTGNLSDATGPFATIDYANGSFTIFRLPSPGMSNNTITFSYTPAAQVARTSQTFQQPITQSTRGYVYTATVHPIPSPGSLQFSYRALGKWYTLNDDGSGALVGDIGVGTGSVDFASGAVSVSLGALPDIGSSAIFAWGGDSEYEIKTGDVTIGNPVVSTNLPAGNCKPSTLTVTWTANSVTKTATDNGSGLLTGDATGKVVYANGAIALKPTLLPDPSTTFNFAYQAATVQTELFNPTKSGSTITMTVAHAPVRPRSMLITYQQTINVDGLSITTTQQLADDGSGGLVDAAGNVKAGAVVNYTTGQVTFNPDFTMITPTLNYDGFEQQVPARVADPGTGYFSSIAAFGKWPTGASSASASVGFVNGTNVTIQYKQDSATDGALTHSVAAPPITVDLTPIVSSRVVAGGVMFTLGGRTYLDRGGSLYYGIDPVTNAGLVGGTMDYVTGVATITSWVAASSSTLALLALLTQPRSLPVTIVTGRAPGSPLRPSSFYIQANKQDGTLISATADVDGKIDTANMHGYVDVTTGVFSVAFGAYVLDSSLTADDKAEPWYDASAVSGGYIFRPLIVLPETIRFNCVVQTSLPLDSGILGIDPVRLPPDGRVQAVRPANMIILFDGQVTSMPNPLSSSQVVTLPRGDLAQVIVRDQTGAVVPSQIAGGPTVTGAKCTIDLVAGTITMAGSLDLSAFTQPLVATHRIEDSCLVTDVQITGHVSVSQPLTHGYTASNSHASTALIAPYVGGNVQARYSHLFSQQTWNSAAPNWTDAIIGSPTTAAYNDLTYPIQVLNRDAITEKWALVFTSATAFQIVAQDLGVIGTGNTSTNVAPTNPGTGQPYFVLDYHGFGSGWANGNVIRFDTDGAGFPIWFARTVRSGPASVIDDSFTVEPRWDQS